MNGTSSAALSCSSPKICWRSSWSAAGLLRSDDVVDLGVGVPVLEEATVDHERRQVVVGVQEVREPTVLSRSRRRLPWRWSGTAPTPSLFTLDLEQTALLELTLELGRLVDRVRAVVSRRVADRQVDRRLDPGVGEGLLGRVDVRRLAVLVLERLVGCRPGRAERSSTAGRPCRRRPSRRSPDGR